MAGLRAKNTIKNTIETEGKITRQDIYEILVHSKSKKKEERKKDVEAFLNGLPNAVKNEKRLGGTVKEKILNDLDSYPI